MGGLLLPGAALISVHKKTRGLTVRRSTTTRRSDCNQKKKHSTEEGQRGKAQGLLFGGERIVLKLQMRESEQVQLRAVLREQKFEIAAFD